MTTELNKKLIRDYLEQVFNLGLTDRINNYVAENYTEIYQGEKHRLGIEGAKEHAEGVRNTYSDLNITVDMQIVEGDWVVSCVTVQGRHTGSWLGIKPTGKNVKFTGVNVDKVIEGKIVEHGGAANMLGPLMSIGAVKAVDDNASPHS